MFFVDKRDKRDKTKVIDLLAPLGALAGLDF